MELPESTQIRALTARADAPVKLDTFLRTHLQLSTRQIRQAKFQPGGITVNGIQQRVSYMLAEGDIVKVRIGDCEKTSEHLVPTDTPLDILFEDPDLLIINKQAGIPTHPCGSHYQDSCANQVHAYFLSHGQACRIRPIGRLDLETSGALVFAKNKVAAQRLTAQRSEKIFYKEYLALTEGALPLELKTLPCDKDWRTINLRLKQSEADRRIVLPDPSGSECITHFKILKEQKDSTLLLVRIDTGHMHQIRATFAAFGIPLSGDTLYHASNKKTARTALHAYRIHFLHPLTGTPMTFTAPLPEDLKLRMPDEASM